MPHNAQREHFFPRVDYVSDELSPSSWFMAPLLVTVSLAAP